MSTVNRSPTRDRPFGVRARGRRVTGRHAATPVARPQKRDDPGVTPASIASTTWGSGDDVLVFLHALLPHATGRSIAATAARLTARLPVRVVGMDAPGFGGSTPLPNEEYDLGLLSARLGDVAAPMAGAPFVVAGHSWGAALAVRIAAARPRDVRGLVLLDGGHFDHADLPQADPAETVEQ